MRTLVKTYIIRREMWAFVNSPSMLCETLSGSFMNKVESILGLRRLSESWLSLGFYSDHKLRNLKR